MLQWWSKKEKKLSQKSFEIILLIMMNISWHSSDEEPVMNHWHSVRVGQIVTYSNPLLVQTHPSFRQRREEHWCSLARLQNELGRPRSSHPVQLQREKSHRTLVNSWIIKKSTCVFLLSWSSEENFIRNLLLYTQEKDREMTTHVHKFKDTTLAKKNWDNRALSSMHAPVVWHAWLSQFFWPGKYNQRKIDVKC